MAEKQPAGKRNRQEAREAKRAFGAPSEASAPESRKITPAERRAKKKSIDQASIDQVTHLFESEPDREKIFTQLRELGWDDARITETLGAAGEQLEQQIGASLPDDSGSASTIPDSGGSWVSFGSGQQLQQQQQQQAQAGDGPKSEHKNERAAKREIARNDAFQILRDRKAGKSDEEITELMKGVGYSEKDIAFRFKFADDIAHSQETKPLREKGRKVLEAIEARLKKRESEEPAAAAENRDASSDISSVAAVLEGEEQAAITARIAAAHGQHAEPAPIDASVPDADVDTSHALNPFAVGEVPVDVEAQGERAKDEESLPEAVVAEETQSDVEPLHPTADIGTEEAHALSESKTEPYDEHGEFVQNLPRELKRAYWKLEDDLTDSINAGDRDAQQRAMTRLDEFKNAHQELHAVEPEAPIEAEEMPVVPRETLEAVGASESMGNETTASGEAAREFSDSDRSLLGSVDSRAERIAQIRTRLAELESMRVSGTEHQNDFIEASNLELELEDLEADAQRTRVLTGEAPTPFEEGNADMSQMEGTRKEWRERLRGLIAGATEKAVAGKEKIQWWKSAEEGLIRRNAELDREAEKIGGIESLFRNMGERYNSMPFKYKLAVGASLGLGAVFTAGTLAVALPLLGIAGQRVAGLASMYLKFEKNSHTEAWGDNKEWGKQKALLKAGAYTVLLGLTMKEAIALASETQIAHSIQAKVEGWLGSMFGHHGAPAGVSKPEVQVPSAHPPENAAHPPAPAALQPAAPASVPAVESAPPVVPAPQPAAGASEASPAQPAAAAAAGAEAVPAVPPEATEIDVAASKGHGYEYMTKRLWEQLQEKHITLPEGAAQKSDLARLINATPETIDAVVHKLAQENEFFKDTGSSVRIGLDSHMTIDSNGNILIKGADFTPDGTNLAPDEAPVTPSHPNAGSGDVKIDAQPLAEQRGESLPEATSDTPGATEAGPHGVETSLEREAHAVSVSKEDIIPQMPAPVENHDFIVNTYEVAIPITEPHVYADGAKFYVYGGSQAEQAKKMLSFLQKNPSYTVISGDAAGKYRVPWHLIGGKLVPGQPLTTSGFLGFIKSFLPPPNPQEFKKIVD